MVVTLLTFRNLKPLAPVLGGKGGNRTTLEIPLSGRVATFAGRRASGFSRCPPAGGEPRRFLRRSGRRFAVGERRLSPRDARLSSPRAGARAILFQPGR